MEGLHMIPREKHMPRLIALALVAFAAQRARRPRLDAVAVHRRCHGE
jgi:hypothetical protein